MMSPQLSGKNILIACFMSGGDGATCMKKIFKLLLGVLGVSAVLVTTAFLCVLDLFSGIMVDIYQTISN